MANKVGKLVDKMQSNSSDTEYFAKYGKLPPAKGTVVAVKPKKKAVVVKPKDGKSAFAVKPTIGKAVVKSETPSLFSAIKFKLTGKR